MDAYFYNTDKRRSCQCLYCVFRAPASAATAVEAVRPLVLEPTTFSFRSITLPVGRPRGDLDYRTGRRRKQVVRMPPIAWSAA
jgi:hypothetical protein